MPVIDMTDFARRLHRFWFRTQQSRGMSYGPERTNTTHPCMKPNWDEIPVEERTIDVGMARDIFACLDEMGYKVVEKG